MKNIIVISPKVSSQSARILAQNLGAYYENPYNTGNRNFEKYDLIFNYGFSHYFVHKGVVINKPAAIKIAIDKTMTFKKLKNQGITVPFTENYNEACKWIKQGDTVVARSTATGANGVGLKYCTTEEELEGTQATFWTKFVPHTHEFRVNVWRDNVISIYDKVRVEDGEGDKFEFVLYRGQENHPQMVALVKKVWDNTGLDWCGMDIICDKKGNLSLLEINSAPILYPFTVNKLVNLVTKEGVIGEKN